MKIKLIKTKDGSHSFYVPELDEHYHSTHGALTESTYVFINAGLDFAKKQNIHVFEVGFGTALNALLTLEYAIKNDTRISYQSIEAFTLDPEFVKDLNYPNLVEFDNAREIFLKMHELSWDQKHQLHPNFHLTKLHGDIKDFDFPVNWADVIYFDAFGPDKQPSLWKKNIFSKMAKLCRQGGVLTTYSVRGQVKRDLKSLGFKVEKLPGPPGKREILRAVKFGR